MEYLMIIMFIQTPNIPIFVKLISLIRYVTEFEVFAAWLLQSGNHRSTAKHHRSTDTGPVTHEHKLIPNRSTAPLVGQPLYVQSLHCTNSTHTGRPPVPHRSTDRRFI